MNDERFRKIINVFVPAMVKAAEDAAPEVKIEFECPLCQHTAYVVKAAGNGHHHACCPECGISLAE